MPRYDLTDDDLDSAHPIDRFSNWTDDWERPAGGRSGRRRRTTKNRPDLEGPPPDSGGGPDLDYLPIDQPPPGSRWSTWDDATHGPQPWPDWVVTDAAAADTELGVVKTGKEADVHLVSRSVPGTDRACLLAAKRYRTSDHKMFHRDAGYLEGRRVKESRQNRAMANRTQYGMRLLAGQWAGEEFASLSALWKAGAPVPYPVQLHGTELLMEFIGSSDGTAAPRLAQVRPSPAELDELWWQCVDVMLLLARNGQAHGDLSAYNLLVDDGRLVMIDLPQVVDVVANPRGGEFLRRDAENICRWFGQHGHDRADPHNLTTELMSEAGLT